MSLEEEYEFAAAPDVLRHIESLRPILDAQRAAAAMHRGQADDARDDVAARRRALETRYAARREGQRFGYCREKSCVWRTPTDRSYLDVPVIAVQVKQDKQGQSHEMWTCEGCLVADLDGARSRAATAEEAGESPKAVETKKAAVEQLQSRLDEKLSDCSKLRVMWDRESFGSADLGRRDREKLPRIDSGTPAATIVARLNEGRLWVRTDRRCATSVRQTFVNRPVEGIDELGASPMERAAFAFMEDALSDAAWIAPTPSESTRQFPGRALYSFTAIVECINEAGLPVLGEDEYMEIKAKLRDHGAMPPKVVAWCKGLGILEARASLDGIPSLLSRSVASDRALTLPRGRSERCIQAAALAEAVAEAERLQMGARADEARRLADEARRRAEDERRRARAVSDALQRARAEEERLEDLDAALADRSRVACPSKQDESFVRRLLEQLVELEPTFHESILCLPEDHDDFKDLEHRLKVATAAAFGAHRTTWRPYFQQEFGDKFCFDCWIMPPGLELHPVPGEERKVVAWKSWPRTLSSAEWSVFDRAAHPHLQHVQVRRAGRRG